MNSFSKRFLRSMAAPKSNWVGLPPEKVAHDLLEYLRKFLRGGKGVAR